MDLSAVLLAVLTLLAGAVAGWAAGRAHGIDDAGALQAAVATAAAERDAARADVATLRSERDVMATELRGAEVRGAESAARLGSLQQAQDQLKDTFAALSGEALRRSNEQFLELADGRFRQAGIPMSETLTKVETQLREIEKERAGSQRALSQQIEFVRSTGEQLRSETASLVGALRKPQARGRWGELQLRRCVEHAGMTDRCDFFEQQTVTTADGSLRPDLVVRLVGGKSIVIDSKVTLSAYLEAHETSDEAVREQRLAAHARHLRQHVDALAAKAYWSQFSATPEFVVLFVPGDAFLAAALDRDPALSDDAFTKRIHIASPTTLISLLRTVAYAWQQDALADNAREVFELGRELYKRLGTLGGHVDKLGRSLTRAVNDYNGTVGSLESQVLVTARKLHELHVVDAELPEPTGIEASTRPLGKPELVESAQQARAVVALPPPLVDLDRPDLDRPDLELSGDRDRLADYGLHTDDAGDNAVRQSHADRAAGSA